jgi:hypothetical protein
MAFTPRPMPGQPAPMMAPQEGPLPATPTSGAPPDAFMQAIGRLTPDEQIRLLDLLDDNPEVIMLLRKAFPEAGNAARTMRTARAKVRGVPGRGKPVARPAEMGAPMPKPARPKSPLTQY